MTIRNDIVDLFYKPHERKHREIYERNIVTLKARALSMDLEFPVYDELGSFFIPAGDANDPVGCDYLACRRKDLQFTYIPGFATASPSVGDADLRGRTVILNEIFDPGYISRIMALTDQQGILTSKIPVYLYYSSAGNFLGPLQVIDLAELISTGRLAFIIGRAGAEKFLMSPQVSQPEIYFSSNAPADSKLGPFLDDLNKKRSALFLETSSSAEKYYKELTPGAIAARIADGTVKIGIFASRFTSAIQYSSRDCVKALEKIGVSARLLIEDSDIHRLDNLSYMTFFNDFRPDLVIVIDHLRRESGAFPANAGFICWIQDYLPNLFSKEAANATGKLDFIMNAYFLSEEFNELGFPAEHVIEAPIPVNPDIYRAMSVTDEERKEIGADICIISNSGNVESAMSDFMKKFEGHPDRHKIEKAMRTAASKIHCDIYRETSEYFEPEKIAAIIRECFAEEKLVISVNFSLSLASTFKIDVVSNIYKEVTALWLHERGYGMKIWGKTWVTHPILKKYAMGTAGNGEPLARILNSSKISIGSNIAATLHPRLLESTLSGCMYIGNSIPSKHDLCGIRNYFMEDENIILFKGKKDLYSKIDRYLNAPEKRSGVIAKGKAIIEEFLTYEKLMKKMLAHIHKKLSIDIY